MNYLRLFIAVGLPFQILSLEPFGKCEKYSASFTHGAFQNFVDCEISVFPGDVLHLSTCNDSTLVGDTYLRLFDPSNSIELAKGDDGCDESDKGGTSLTYVVPSAYPNTGVSLHLHQGCFSVGSCAAETVFTLNVENSPLPYPTPAPLDDDRSFDIGQCPLEKCLDINYPAKGWNRCDMCICQNFEKIFYSTYDHDCGADDTYYNCMIKYDVKSVSCKNEMKPGWIAAFFFISLFGFICLAFGCGFIIHICFRKPANPIHPTMKAVQIKPQADV